MGSCKLNLDNSLRQSVLTAGGGFHYIFGRCKEGDEGALK